MHRAGLEERLLRIKSHVQTEQIVLRSRRMCHMDEVVADPTLLVGVQTKVDMIVCSFVEESDSTVFLYRVEIAT